jgi:hypothetical protein
LNFSEQLQSPGINSKTRESKIMNTPETSPLLQLHVGSGQSRLLYTTLLQSGIEVKSHAGIAIGNFLCDLDGFTEEYLASSVETLFLNGTPVDDLEQPVEGNSPVLAISAAMPGLAGAIFRKNSFHSALRTTTKPLHSDQIKKEAITVTLKLFNSVAKDRGVELLLRGVTLKAAKVLAFLTKMPNRENHLQSASLNGQPLPVHEMMDFLKKYATIKLQLVDIDG